MAGLYHHGETRLGRVVMVTDGNDGGGGGIGKRDEWLSVQVSITV